MGGVPIMVPAQNQAGSLVWRNEEINKVKINERQAKKKKRKQPWKPAFFVMVSSFSSSEWNCGASLLVFHWEGIHKDTENVGLMSSVQTALFHYDD
jgi:hypothetical protein